MGSFSDQQVFEWLEQLSYEETWMAIHHEDPDLSDPISSEIVGGSYERVQAILGQPVGRVLFNINSVKFSGLPSVTGTHLCGWTDPVGGWLRFKIEFLENGVPAPRRFRLGQTLVINPGDIALSVD